MYQRQIICRCPKTASKVDQAGAGVDLAPANVRNFVVSMTDGEVETKKNWIGDASTLQHLEKSASSYPVCVITPCGDIQEERKARCHRGNNPNSTEII